MSSWRFGREFLDIMPGLGIWGVAFGGGILMIIDFVVNLAGLVLSVYALGRVLHD